MSHAISWFEIPVTDYDRAVTFYETVLDREIDEFENDDPGSGTESEGRYGMFRTDEGEIGGALAQMDEGYTPVNGETTIPYTSIDEAGPILYLTIENDLDDALSAVPPAGGTVLVGKEATGEGSSFAIVTDTEGNRVGLFAEE